MRRWALAFVLLACSMQAGFTQVRSVRIGVDVNSPYGISEPWATIREGLLRQAEIEFVSPQPDRKAGTGELRMKGGRVPDVDALAKAVAGIGAGASLRGVEATIDGELDKQRGEFVLRIKGTDQVLPLQRATRCVGRDQSLTDVERKAFETLAGSWAGSPIPVCVTGAIVKRSAAAGSMAQALEVRSSISEGEAKPK